MLEFRFETDGQKRAELVEHGDVDFAMNLPEGDTSDPYPQTTVLLLNQRAESLENESLRRALSLVIDRSALVEGLSCDAAEGIVPPGLRNTMGGDFRTESGSLVDNAPDNYEALCQQAKTLLGGGRRRKGRGADHPFVRYLGRNCDQYRHGRPGRLEAPAGDHRRYARRHGPGAGGGCEPGRIHRGADDPDR